MSADRFLRLLCTRWRWLAGSVLVTTLIGGLLAFTLPQEFDARAQVIVTVDSDAGVSAAESALYVEERVPTILEIARSNEFAAEVARSTAVDRSTAEVRESLEFTVVPETWMIEIHARDRDGRQASELATQAATTMTGSFLSQYLGNSNGIDVTLLQNVDGGRQAAFPDPLRFLAFGALSGLLLGLLLAPISHSLDRTTRDPREVAEILGTKLLAVRIARPGWTMRRRIAESGAVTTIAGLLGRLGLGGPSRGTVSLAIGGIDGAGNELAADLLEVLAAGGSRCALVTADTNSLLMAHYRELSKVPGLSIVDISSHLRGGILTRMALLDALTVPTREFDLIVMLCDDLVGNTEVRSYLDMSDMVLLACPPRPALADLRSTHELMEVSEVALAGFVLGEAPHDRTTDRSIGGSTDRSSESTVELDIVPTHTEHHPTRNR